MKKHNLSPTSPYAVAKVYAYWMVKNYREGYNIFASNGILFNHESPRRGEIFRNKKNNHGHSKYIGEETKVFVSWQS